MKANSRIQKSFAAAALGLLLAASPAAFAASDVPIVIDSNLSAWLNAWGPAYVGMSYDANDNAVYVQQSWSGGNADDSIAANLDDCNGWIGCGPGVDGRQYESIDFDIMFPSTNNVVLSTGGSAGFEIGFFHGGYNRTTLTNFFPSASAGFDGTWHHLSVPIPLGAIGNTNIMAVSFYCWQPDGTTGTFDYAVKNLVVKARPVVLGPPPMLTPERIKTPGVWLGTFSHGGGTRNSVYTPLTNGNGVSWVGVATPANPVTYSMTIDHYPDSAKYPGVQSHILLSSDLANNEGAPEWNSTNCIFFRIMNNADGSAYANFMFKTNSPGSNGRDGWGGQIFGIGNLVQVTSKTVTGTWSIKFTSDTACTITTPDNTSTNFTFPADAVPYFSYVFASFGMQQNGDTYTNQYVLLSHASVSGPYGIDDYFTNGIPDSSFAVAGPQSGTQSLPAGSAWFAKYLIQASGFGLTVSPDLVHWTDSSAPLWEFDGEGWLPLGPADLKGAQQNFFRMVMHTATQLQVLLPGETNAPGTATGKIGTPLPQSQGVPFDVTVNACDVNWNIAKACNDTVEFTSTDTSAWLPPQTALVNGSVTIPGNTYFGSPGTWTITASDVTTNTVSSGTSTPLTIP